LAFICRRGATFIALAISSHWSLCWLCQQCGHCFRPSSHAKAIFTVKNGRKRAPKRT